MINPMAHSGQVKVILPKVGTSNINSATASKFMFTYSGSSTSSPAKAVASFMDTNAWSFLASGINGAQAIASPTLEMFHYI